MRLKQNVSGAAWPHSDAQARRRTKNGVCVKSVHAIEIADVARLTECLHTERHHGMPRDRSQPRQRGGMAIEHRHQTGARVQPAEQLLDVRRTLRAAVRALAPQPPAVQAIGRSGVVIPATSRLLVVIVGDEAGEAGSTFAGSFASFGYKPGAFGLLVNVSASRGQTVRDAARNLGIREAKGDWIAFLDADDLWREDHLEVLAHAMADAPNAGAVATRFDHVFADRRQPQRIARRLEQGGVLSFRQFLEAWLEVRECPLWTGAIAFRRDLLIEAGLFPEGRAVRGGDKDLWLRVMRLTRLAYAPVRTAEFSRESVNKVSNSTDTLSRPCLVETARAMMAGASRAERRLLRRLINQEIGHYVRYSMKGAGRINIPAGEIALPEGIGTLALLMAARWLPASIRQAGHSLSRRATSS